MEDVGANDGGANNGEANNGGGANNGGTNNINDGENNAVAVLFSGFASCMSIGVLLNGIWLSQQAATSYIHYFDIPLIVLSSFLVALHIFGLYGAFTGLTWILGCYARGLFILILLTFGITTFVVGITNTIPGVPVPGNAYMVRNNHGWLMRTVNENWNKITSFFQQTKICDHYLSSTIQSGCCKPSNDCSNSSSTNPDCSKWSSDDNVLCYGCESCKIAWTNRIRPIWRRAAITNFVLLIFVMVGNVVLFHSVHPWPPVRSRRRRSRPVPSPVTKDEEPINNE